MNDPQQQPIDHQGLLRQAMAQAPTGPAAAGPAPSIEELAERFPDYELSELIGRGGMGVVYKATQRNLNRPVAIKVLPTELAKDPEFGERFLREARALASLNHPSILTVHDFGERDGLFFLVTEFIDGVNLRQLMELGELSAAEALRIAPQICIALQFAHERGVVHRDIKPENILIDVDGQVKIADFGLAKVARPGDQVELTRGTAVIGTPHYMAPEQWRGTASVDHRADIYSLGVVLYEMLTGQLPLGNFDPPSQRKGVPHGLDQIVRRALAQQPENRYQHARDVQSDVEQQAKKLGDRAASASKPAAGARLVKEPFVAIVAVLLAAVAIGLMIFIVEQNARTKYRFADSLGRYDATMERVAEQVRTGAAIDDSLPSLPTAPDLPLLSMDAARAVALGIFAAALLFVLAVGIGSIQRIRNSNGKLTGMGLAVFVAWVVPLGLVNALALAAVGTINSNDLQAVVGLFMGVLLAAGDIWFLVWETRRQRRLVEQAVPVRRGRALPFVAMLLILFGLYSLTGVTSWLPIDASDYELAAGPTRPDDLLGQPREVVLARLGPPLAMQISANTEAWAYAGPKQQITEALVLSGNSVVSFDRSTPVLLPNEVPSDEPHIGQSIDEFVRAYGAPTDRREGALLTRFTFANGTTVSVRNGIVVRHGK